MKLLLSSNYQRPHLGGIEIIAEQLKLAWERQGHEVTWITTDVPRGAAKQAADNVRIPALNFFETHWQINSPVVNPLRYLQVDNLVKRHDAVNVHTLAPGLTTLVTLAALRRRKPLLITQQVSVIPLESKWLDRLQERWLTGFARYCTRRGARLSFVSKAVSDWFLNVGRVDPACTSMTPNAYDKQIFFFVDDAARVKAASDLGFPGDRFRVLFVGRFVGKKGLAFIEAAARQCPDVHFTLIGEGVIDPTKWGLANVQIIPIQRPEDLPSYFAAHDLLLLPSVGEGWPLVICEAMACGTPCLISRETFLNFDEAEQMFLVSDLEVESLVSALRRAQRGECELLRNRRLVAEFARNTWDWDVTARLIADLLQETADQVATR